MSCSICTSKYDSRSAVQASFLAAGVVAWWMLYPSITDVDLMLSNSSLHTVYDFAFLLPSSIPCAICKMTWWHLQTYVTAECWLWHSASLTVSLRVEYWHVRRLVSADSYCAEMIYALLTSNS